MRLSSIIFILLFGLLPTMLCAQSLTTKKRTELQSVRQEIQAVQQTLAQRQQQRNQLQQQLKAIEIKIGASAKQLHEANLALDKQLKKLNALQLKQKHLNAQVIKQKAMLLNYIRTAYMLGRQQYLKLLLNQQNPSKIMRYITYYHYLTHARLQLVESINSTLKTIDITKSQIESATASLQKKQATEYAQNQRLIHQRDRRQFLLKGINSSIATQQQRLQALRTNKTNLHHVIREIQTEKYFYAPGKNFYQARGKLPWPIRSAKILQGYNEPLFNGVIRTSGLLLKAREGTPIHAIFKGKVVFANWLRGYGLLAIVQHGKNFMTLYGHAESLYVSVGQSVIPGQIIATVGNSGGYQQYALYFELRHDDATLDPFKWLRARS